jgi:hypothetical protein
MSSSFELVLLGCRIWHFPLDMCPVILAFTVAHSGQHRSERKRLSNSHAAGNWHCTVQCLGDDRLRNCGPITATSSHSTAVIAESTPSGTGTVPQTHDMALKQDVEIRVGDTVVPLASESLTEQPNYHRIALPSF